MKLQVRDILRHIPKKHIDHIVAQDVRRLESLDIPRIPNLDLELRRDSAPGGSSSLQGCCNHLPYLRSPHPMSIVT